MKVLLTAILSLLLLTSFGQDLTSAENALLKAFKQIDYWRDYQRNGDLVSQSDSLEKANVDFQNSLLTFTSRFAATINYPFTKLVEQKLTIATSADRLFRIYSWDTWTGGTMHFFRNVYQFKAGGKVYSKVIIDSTAEGDPGVWYSNIYLLKNNNKTYYLAVNHAIFSTKDSYQGIQAFYITGHSLNERIKLIKTKTGIRNSLSFSFNFFSVVDRPERPVKLIVYDSSKKTIRLPVVTEDGTVTNKSIMYRFTGKYFEHNH